MASTNDLSDTIIDLVKSGEDFVLDTDRNWVGTVEGIVPEVPYADELAPKGVEAVDKAFAFAERLLSQQHGFTVDLLKSVAPLYGTKVEAPAPKVTKVA